jgi:hypothetical protein
MFSDDMNGIDDGFDEDEEEVCESCCSDGTSPLADGGVMDDATSSGAAVRAGAGSGATPAAAAVSNHTSHEQQLRVLWLQMTVAAAAAGVDVTHDQHMGLSSNPVGSSGTNMAEQVTAAAAATFNASCAGHAPVPLVA